MKILPVVEKHSTNIVFVHLTIGGSLAGFVMLVGGERSSIGGFGVGRIGCVDVMFCLAWSRYPFTIAANWGGYFCTRLDVSSGHAVRCSALFAWHIMENARLPSAPSRNAMNSETIVYGVVRNTGGGGVTRVSMSNANLFYLWWCRSGC